MKKIYLIPKIQILDMGNEAVMAADSWNDGHGNWKPVIEGNPKDEDPDDSYAKFKCDWSEE